MLHIRHQVPILGYSKGSRGLSVLARVRGILTTTAISPSLSKRQCSSRYAIHAGRNLPDKELRYLRTVIVTAAVYRGFGRQLPLRSSPPLTYRHRAGVRLYTSSCELAESCVFDKQSLEPILCGSPFVEHPLYRGYGVILPSSFTRVLPNAFGCSPSTPVSDCGTGRAVRPRPAFRGRGVIGLPDRAVGLAARGRLAPRPESVRRPRTTQPPRGVAEY